MDEWDARPPSSLGETALLPLRSSPWRRKSVRRLIRLGVLLSLPLVALIVILASWPSSGTNNGDPDTPQGPVVNGNGAAPAESRLPANYVAVPGTDLWLPKPAGFTVSADLPGFKEPGSGASVAVLELKTPFDQLRKSITPETVKNQGMETLEWESVTVDECSGILIHARQTVRGSAHRVWRLTFGDHRGSNSIIATFPESFEGDFSATLRDTVLAAKSMRGKAHDEMGDLGFGIDVPPGLKFARRDGLILQYTRDGKPRKSAGEPLCLVGSIEAPPPDADPKRFAEQLLTRTGQLSRVNVQRASPTMVDGVQGYELEAIASDATGQVPMMAYQLTLFCAGRCFFIQGLINDRYESHYLPAFRAMGRSFRQR